MLPRGCRARALPRRPIMSFYDNTVEKFARVCVGRPPVSGVSGVLGEAERRRFRLPPAGGRVFGGEIELSVVFLNLQRQRTVCPFWGLKSLEITPANWKGWGLWVGTQNWPRGSARLSGNRNPGGDRPPSCAGRRVSNFAARCISRCMAHTRELLVRRTEQPFHHKLSRKPRKSAFLVGCRHINKLLPVARRTPTKTRRFVPALMGVEASHLDFRGGGAGVTPTTQCE